MHKMIVLFMLILIHTYNMLACRKNANKFLVDSKVHPQTIAIIQTRAKYLGVTAIVSDHTTWDLADKVCLCGYVVVYGAFSLC